MIKEILIFGGGLIVGAAGGIIGTRMMLKKKYEDKYDEEIQKTLDKHFKEQKKQHEENVTVKSSLNDKTVAEDVETVLKSMAEKAKKNQNVDYTAYSEGIEAPDDMIVKPEKSIVEPEDADDEDDEDEVSAWDEQFEANYIRGLKESVEMESHRHDRPKIIKHSQYGEYGTLTQAPLIYYQEDDTLVDPESDEVVEDLDLYVGNCLDKYGFRRNAESVLYVRNMFLGYDFEITKRFDSYAPIGNETG